MHNEVTEKLMDGHIALFKIRQRIHGVKQAPKMQAICYATLFLKKMEKKKALTVEF